MICFKAGLLDKPLEAIGTRNSDAQMGKEVFDCAFQAGAQSRAPLFLIMATFNASCIPEDSSMANLRSCVGSRILGRYVYWKLAACSARGRREFHAY